MEIDHRMLFFFLQVYPNHRPQNLETDLENNGLREKVDFMDFRNYLFINSLYSHLVLEEGGKTTGTASPYTKAPLWVLQSLGY